MASISSLFSPPNLLHNPTKTPLMAASNFPQISKPFHFQTALCSAPSYPLSLILQPNKRLLTPFAVAEEAALATSLTARRLYIGNIPRTVDNAELTRIVQDHGAVEKAEVMYDKYSGRSRRFAFVTMKTVEDANAVTEKLNETEIGGRKIKVNITEKPLTAPDLSLVQAEESQFIDSPHKVYVGNLAKTVTTDSLKSFFSARGLNIISAKISRVPGTSKSSGFGFLTFSSEEDAEAAISSVNNAFLDRQRLRVNKA